MSQAGNWSVPLIGPTTPTDMFQRIDEAFDALLSGHSGNARPGYAVAGTIWASVAVAGQISFFLFDGTNDHLIFVLDENRGSIAHSDAEGASGRLTLQSGIAAPSADVTAAGNLYFTPYKGSRLGLFVNGDWIVDSFDELPISLAGLAAGRPYDVFAYANAGALASEMVAWNSDTVRLSALGKQNGINVKNGDPSRRYLGTIYTSAAGQCEDSLVKRYVWNMHNRVLRPLSKLPTIASWTYNTQAWRQANGDASNQLDFVRGLDEDEVSATAMSIASSTATSTTHRNGIGLDSATAVSGMPGSGVSAAAGSGVFIPSSFDGMVGIGRHTLKWLEYGAGSGTSTFYGVLANVYQSGIQGRMMM